MPLIVSAIVISLFFFTGNSCADQIDDPESKNTIKPLYTCYFFFNASTRAKDLALRDKSEELSSMFLLKASMLAVKAGGKEYAKTLSREAADEYKSFLSSVRSTSGQNNKNRRMKDFISNCSKVGNIPIDLPSTAPNASDRLDKARKLYACFSFFSEGSRGAKGEQKEKLSKVASAFLLKATQEVTAVDVNKDPLDTELAEQTGALGKNDFSAFMESVRKLPTESERNEKLGTFVSNCASMAGMSKQKN